MTLTEDQIETYHARGLVTVPGLFTKAEVASLRSALGRILAEERHRPELIREKDNDAVRLVYGADTFDDTYHRLLHHPRWIGPARQLLASDIYLHQLRINPKAAFDGGGWWWHQDYHTWRTNDGMPTPRALMIGVFLDDMTPANGPLMVIPGSHRHGLVEDTTPDPDRTGYTVYDLKPELIARLVEEGGIEPLLGEAGSTIFMNCNLVHGSTGNISPYARTIVYINVNSVENAATRFGRPRYFANPDFTPLAPLGDDCLATLS